MLVHAFISSCLDYCNALFFFWGGGCMCVSKASNLNHLLSAVQGF